MSDAGEKRRGAVPIPGQIEDVQRLTEATAQRLIKLVEGSAPVQKLRASQLVSGFLGAVGFALFIAGIENAAHDIPIVSNAYGSIVVGILLLAVTGLLLKQLASRD